MNTYRQPKVILGGKVMETFGLGQSTGSTFFPRSTTGFKEGILILDIYIYNTYFYFQHFFN